MRGRAAGATRLILVERGLAPAPAQPLPPEPAEQAEPAERDDHRERDEAGAEQVLEDADGDALAVRGDDGGMTAS